MTVWHFDTTGEAYDACQCDDRLKDGDTLVCGHWCDLPEGWLLRRSANCEDDGDPLSISILADCQRGQGQYDTVVGIVSTWPTAVTKINGQLHKFKDPHTVQLNAMKESAAFHGVMEALKIADNMGLELDDGFVCPRIVEEMHLHDKDFSGLANGGTRK